MTGEASRKRVALGLLAFMLLLGGGVTVFQIQSRRHEAELRFEESKLNPHPELSQGTRRWKTVPAVSKIGQVAAAIAEDRKLAPGTPFPRLSQLAERGLLDAELGQGMSSGYTFVARASPGNPGKWCVIGSPLSPSPDAPFLFVNQEGKTFGGEVPFEVDPSTCAVPPGLLLLRD